MSCAGCSSGDEFSHPRYPTEAFKARTLTLPAVVMGNPSTTKTLSAAWSREVRPGAFEEFRGRHIRPPCTERGDAEAAFEVHANTDGPRNAFHGAQDPAARRGRCGPRVA